MGRLALTWPMEIGEGHKRGKALKFKTSSNDRGLAIAFDAATRRYIVVNVAIAKVEMTPEMVTGKCRQYPSIFAGEENRATPTHHTPLLSLHDKNTQMNLAIQVGIPGNLVGGHQAHHERHGRKKRVTDR